MFPTISLLDAPPWMCVIKLSVQVASVLVLHRQNSYTPWKINMEPENDGLEDDFPFQLGDF